MNDSAPKRDKPQQFRVYAVMGRLTVGPIDLNEVAKKLEHLLFEPEMSPALIIESDGCSISLYSSGQIICFGGTQSQIEKSTQELLAHLSEIGVKVQEGVKVDFKNHTAIWHSGKRFRIWKILYLLDGAHKSTGGPEQIILHLKHPRITFEIFENGTVICLGAKSEEEIAEALSYFEKNATKSGCLAGPNKSRSAPTSLRLVHDNHNFLLTCEN